MDVATTLSVMYRHNVQSMEFVNRLAYGTNNVKVIINHNTTTWMIDMRPFINVVDSTLDLV